MRVRVIANTPEVLEKVAKNKKATETYHKRRKERLKANVTAHAGAEVRGVTTNRKSLRQIRKWAFSSGIMPHEFMLRLMRGETVSGYKCTIQERIDIAKAVAPYFIPKLQNIAHTGDDNEGPVRVNTLNINTNVLKSLNDAELDLLERVIGKIESEPSNTEGSDTSGEIIEGDADAYSASLYDDS